MDIDNLNNLETETRQAEDRKPIDIDTYFDDMDLTKEQIEERKEAAKDFNDFMLFIFAVILAQHQYGYVDYAALQATFSNGYQDEISKYMDVDRNLRGYTEDFAETTLETTKAHLASELVGVVGIQRTLEVLGDSYYLSEARAVETAVNMALDVINYKDYVTAIARGYKHKKWIAIRDKHTRKTHGKADGQIVPIGEYFHVGKALLAYPHDTVTSGSTGADHLEEIISCRCSFRYTR